MRSPAWIAAYAVVLVPPGAAYASLVSIGAGLALASAPIAPVAMLVALSSVIFK